MTLPGRIVLMGLCLIVTSSLTCDGRNPVDPEPDDSRLYLSLRHTDWQQASRPDQVDPSYLTGRLLWHTPLEMVPAEQVFDSDVVPGEGLLPVFRMIHRPHESQKSWAGVTTGLSALMEGKAVDFFEVRLKGDRGKLHFECGRICEDIDGDNVLDSEDHDMNGGVDLTLPKLLSHSCLASDYAMPELMEVVGGCSPAGDPRPLQLVSYSELLAPVQSGCRGEL